ncbi:MAG: LysR family transcriptional regulator [Pseudomonadales bacterium]|nr:LysR family transcriptional regulator [Pseudomonadales bacterium]
MSADLNARISIEQWLVFITVLETGSYTAAAKQLNRTQSAISYAIRKMEDLLEAELFIPDGRNVRPTALSNTLQLPATRFVNDAVALERLAMQRPASWESEISLFVDVIFPNELLIKALKVFSQQYPGIRVVLDQGVFSSTIDAMNSGVADLGICPYIPNGFIGKSITQIEFVPVAHPDYELASKHRSLSLTDLQQHTQIVIKDDAKYKRELGWLGGQQRWSVTHMESAIEAIKSGIGYGWVATHLIQQELDAGELEVLSLDAFGVYNQPLHLVFGATDTGPGRKALAEILLDIGKSF